MPVSEHVETINLHDIVITPAHADRTASAEFERSVKRLKEDGHYKCWVCGVAEGIQVHHFGCEWSLEGFVDFSRLKDLLEAFDIYGYGRLMKNTPLTSVDDVRNMMCLCQQHHTGVNHTANNATGIHDLVFPMWIIQAMAKAGDDPVPQSGETVEATEKRISPAA